MEVANLTTYPIDHWSYSSMMMFLRNPFGFKKQYILKIYDYKQSPSAIVGKAAHKALEFYLKGNDVHTAAEAGMAVINSVRDDDVEWGKTGSREKVIQDFTKAFNGYIGEFKVRGEILGIEKSLTNFINYNGQELAIPIKSITDLIERTSEGIEITDHKFVSYFTDSEEDKGMYAIQAMFNYLNCQAEYGEAPVKMHFNEYRISANKNGDAQLQPYTIDFRKSQHYFEVFFNLYNDCTREITRPDKVYLPNFQDMFGGSDTFKDYSAQLITVENPIVVQHKTGDFKFVEKAFVSAPVNIVDNQYLAEEEKVRIKLLEFGIPVEMQETFNGSSIIKYTLKASRGVKMSQFNKHEKDLAIALKAKNIRIEAPIMGTDLVGIEVPNPNRKTVEWSEEMLEDETTMIPIGVDVYGNSVKKDLADMPHLLVAGATGSGKSVMINVIIKSLITQMTSDRLKLVLIDPKRVEMSQYKGDSHLLTDPIYETGDAKRALKWLVEEMEDRYGKLERAMAKDIRKYNENSTSRLPYIVVVIDEFADLMLASEEHNPETEIVRIAQKARAVGIHLIIGTQRPSVDVITGLIKANVPTRIAFMTSSKIDSQVILDQAGAEELTGRGDMLFLDPHTKGLQRLQGYYL